MTVLSARPLLLAVIDEIVAHRIPHIPTLRAAIAVVSDLIFFVVSTSSTDPLTCDGTLLVERQRMLREQGVLDACASVPKLAFQGTCWFWTCVSRNPNTWWHERRRWCLQPRPTSPEDSDCPVVAALLSLAHVRFQGQRTQRVLLRTGAVVNELCSLAMRSVVALCCKEL